jgi:dCMP deaminase
MGSIKETQKELFSKLVETLGSFSTADRAQVGCIILKDGRIVSTGYNGQLPGQPHDMIMQNGHDISTVHAEQNAICSAAKNGVSLKDCEAFVTHSPCQLCTKLLIMSGIKKVYYLKPYRIDENPFFELIETEEVKTNE